MKLVDGNETLVLVTGSSPAATQKDRPLAVWLQEEIDRRGGGHGYRRAVLVADARYVNTPALHAHPTIAIGGPGSNDVVQHLTEVLPMVWAQDERSFVQMATHETGRQAALWGMDAEGTRGAVEAFVREGMLDALLDRVWRLQTGNDQLS
ncbi:MAG TPA: hypothetical protein VGA42_08455 [Gemmatimonadales bacterium]|jgi:hypothetical protein